MTLKPIPPTKYDGSVDSKAFHCFITEGTTYVKDGQVPSKKRAFILSHYLTGKAHEFYIREVSGDPYGWRLPEFFRELFNYCFPVDFRIKQRRKLLRCYQNDQKVRDYIYELNELWVMIGETDERTQVHKLWFGLRKEIQHDLWREKLNPEISSLKDVIAAAEIIEIAQSVTSETNGKGRTKTSTAVRSAAATPDGGERAQRRSRRSSRREKKHNDPKSGKTDGQSKGKGKDRPKKAGSKPKLSKDEQERHKSEGLCFNCHRAGHFSRNCPDLNKVTLSSTGSNPPGVTSFGVNIDYATIEEQRESSCATKANLSLGTISLAVCVDTQGRKGDLPDLRNADEINSEVLTTPSEVGELSDWDNVSNEEPVIPCDPLDSSWVESCAMSIESEGVEFLSDSSGSDTTMDPPFESQFFCCESRPGEMGYPLGDRASERLDGIAYPVEDASTPGVLDRGRFHVHPVAGRQHAILDALQPFEQEVLIDTCLLRYPQFTIDQWYWRKHAESLGRSSREYRAKFMRADFSPPMGTPVAEQIVLCLTDGVLPDGIGLGNEHRFQCLYHAGEEAYEIRDQHLML